MNYETGLDLEEHIFELNGLTFEQQQTAIYFKNQVEKAQSDYEFNKSAGIEAVNEERRRNLLAASVFSGLRILNDLTGRYLIIKAVIAAEKHYHANEIAYEEQAEKEAILDGIEINR